MNKIIITSAEELAYIVDKSIGDRMDGLTQLIQQKITPSKKKATVKDVAKRLNVTELTVRNYISRGIIKADKIGRRILIDLEALEEALKEVKSLKYRR
ncbi:MULTISPECIES: helix-turn-helix domain-containing protein [unclassified Arenibacter]|uniref:helix-turn-helix domain-containing protein n=1 Tax=unclassified Arenibacter TaxID=2615047 RepID=UPI000E34C3A6|nr:MULTISPECIES: helix-turn-helix domain-containing protein [unclassified Arenibacter]MCM4162986.1 hypothetical protein [Arenibacter sp. A80]RFT57025.1 DNA-binding protein [Arenibacter sp. P308M17]